MELYWYVIAIILALLTLPLVDGKIKEKAREIEEKERVRKLKGRWVKISKDFPDEYDYGVAGKTGKILRYDDWDKEVEVEVFDRKLKQEQDRQARENYYSSSSKRGYRQIDVPLDFITFLDEQEKGGEQTEVIETTKNMKRMPRVFRFFIYGAIVALAWKVVFNAEAIASFFVNYLPK